MEDIRTSTHVAVHTFKRICSGLGGRVVGVLAPSAPCSTLCGVVGSSPIAARSRGPPHHWGLSMAGGMTMAVMCDMYVG